jgi:hypothetical protein
MSLVRAILVVSAFACQGSSRVYALPSFGDSFWRLWGDGKAELSGYELTIPRYGELRQGVAVTVFVTETFSRDLRVKADPGMHSASDEFPVMKLNLVQDFPTGIYDYNVMTSAFVALSPVGGLPAGAPAKVSFSAQEWCGHAYSQALFDTDRIRYQIHSYFDGEADRSGELTGPAGILAEDGLLLWARGFGGPPLNPGDTREVPMLRSLRLSRLSHAPLVLETVSLTRGTGKESVTVPAGTYDVEKYTAAIQRGRLWTFYVETGEPHRVVRWTCSDGEEASLLASERLKYWEMHDRGLESAVEKLGLTPRGRKMP